MSSSFEIGFVIFRVVIPTLLLLIQILLYIRTRKWLREVFPHKRWMQWLAASLFVVMNVALLYVMITRPRPSEFPSWFLYLGAYPFFIWHGATLFIGLLLLISMIIKAPFQLFGTLLKRLKPIPSEEPDVAANPHPDFGLQPQRRQWNRQFKITFDTRRQ